ncbi:MAG: putative Ig domain-containing protein [Bacteroidales bacterium]|nr:putative Ig domain-containing protein [Bacteroidales bacterium]
MKILSSLSFQLTAWFLFLGFGTSGILVAGSPSAKAVPATDPCMSNLVSFFRFSEGSGSLTYDETGTRSIPLDGFAGWTSGRVGSGVSFNGVDQRLAIEDHADFDWTLSQDFTIELWCKLSGDPESYQVIIGRETGGSTHWWIGLTPEKRPAFYLYDESASGGGVQGSDSINDGEWHHLAAVHIASEGRNRIYIDGVLHGDSTYAYSTDFNCDEDIEIGNFYSALAHKFFFQGTLDEIAVSNRAIPTSEIYAHYIKGLNGVDYCTDYSSAPVFMSVPDTLAMKGQKYNYTVHANGYPEPIYDLIQAPSGMSLNTGNNTLSWTPASSGRYDVLLRAANIAGNQYQSFTIEVLEPCIEGMVSFMSFNEGSGATSMDLGNLQIIPVAGHAEWTTGKYASGLSFNGTDEGISMEASESYNWTQDQDFTLELWMKTGSGKEGIQVLMGRDTPGSTHWWMGLNAEYKAVFYLYDNTRTGGGINGTDSLNDNKWHHLAAVYNGLLGMVSLYVDGELNSQNSFSYTGDFDTESELQIGNLYYNAAYSFFYEGLVDEIALHSEGLSSEEILAHYLKGIHGVSYCDDLVLEPSITSTAVTSTFSNAQYSYDVNAAGLPAPTYHLTIFPDGMIIDTSSGLIDWDPIGPGSYPVEVVAMNGGGEDVQNFTLTIRDACITEGLCYFDFNETGGTVVFDSFAGLEGQLVNSPLRQEGISGNSLYFNGIDHSVIIPDNELFDFDGGKGFSFEFWCKPAVENTGLQVILGRDESASVQWWLGLQADTKLPSVYVFDENRVGNGLTGLIPFSDGKWHHLAAVYNGTAEILILYIDGVLNNQLEVSFSTGFSAASVIQMGSLYKDGSFQYYYEGGLDELVIFDRPLSSEEVDLHFNLGKSGLDYCFTDKPDLVVQNIQKNDLYKVYPSPAHNSIFVEFRVYSPTTVEVQLLNTLGMICYQRTIPASSTTELDVSGLAGGYYILRVIDSGGILGQQKIIIR